ncbi:MAG: hypothetical protein Q7I92_13300, partial [Humidesulfovibrio sp.]|nr:hypothetical protein [Humidesulfovibrio sp.]
MSHILPAFAFRWLRDTSANAYLRSVSMPNRRIQDGLKRHWLCATCEGQFGRSESAFAENVFYPYLADSSGKFQYSRWLLYFCTSLSWRVLKYLTGEPYFEKWEPEEKLLVAKAEAAWRAVLLGEEPHPGVYRQHILPLDAIANTPIAFPPNINRYLMRAIDMDLCRGERTIFVYSKLGRFVIIGIVSEDNANHWRGTKVHANGGTVQPRTYGIPLKFMNYIKEKAGRVFESLG